MKIDMKLIGLFCLVLFAGALSYLIFFPSSGTTPKEFFGKYSHSSKAGIVVDITRASDPVVRRNMMQCGTDFLSSSGNMINSGKLSYYLLDNNICYLSDFSDNQSNWGNAVELKACASNYSEYPYIQILPGDKYPDFSGNVATVYVGNNYTYGQCALYVDTD